MKVKDYNEILKDNFAKVAEYIKQKYPHAIERSYESDIKCDSPHHVYYTSYIVLSKGDIHCHFGSHGWSDNDVIYSANQREWVSRVKSKDTRLEVFLLEWEAHKSYIDNTLSGYERMFDFKI
ncbi:MAG: hypothetical protein IJP79_07290 [Paludibacteraceae bacterium]|nr:hypothetical protein [Paludibacteraceae bacterium]MBQ6963488.1 hypothetical protein [Paludibacteraceae bacterium]MBQ7662498.1 hypothetical protein [Prevotella sp.]MBQ7748277.1 hypothetical protein [Paludibacteraceae bacterium]